MNFHQQPDENRHKQRPRQNVAANDIQAEVRQQNEPQSLENVQLVRDLRVDFAVRVVGAMPGFQAGEDVHGEVEGEEEGVVDDEACH